MSLMTCRACTCRCAVGLPRCPQCGGRDLIEGVIEVPKVTVHGGASNAAESPPAPAPEVVEVAAGPVDTPPTASPDAGAPPDPDAGVPAGAKRRTRKTTDSG